MVMKVESYLYRKLNGRVECLTCRHRCKLDDGKWGICRVRKNEKGKLYAYNYGLVSSIALDPIEKKPFHNFMPATKALSFGSISCNFRCKHCQNYTIAFADLNYPCREMSVDEVVEAFVQSGAEGVAWTYNEPAIWHEFTLDSSIEIKKRRGYVVYVTNGYMSEEALEQFVEEKALDAANVDVKAFNEEFYRKICKAKLEEVLNSVECMHEKGVFLELTYLVIPTLNDSREEIAAFAEWVCELDNRIPVHFSRFHPDFEMIDLPPTPVEKIEEAVEIAYDTGLEYVYAGNVWGHKFENTYCPRCGELLIEREGFYVREMRLDGDRCPECGYRQNIVLSLK